MENSSKQQPVAQFAGFAVHGFDCYMDGADCRVVRGFFVQPWGRATVLIVARFNTGDADPFMVAEAQRYADALNERYGLQQPVRPLPSIEFSDAPFKRSHGRAPKGRGGWAFCRSNSDYGYDRDLVGEPVFAPGGLTLTEAKRWLREQPTTDSGTWVVLS